VTGLLHLKAELLERLGALDEAQEVIGRLYELGDPQACLAEARLKLRRCAFAASWALALRAIASATDEAARLRAHELAAAVACERIDASAIEHHTAQVIELAKRGGSPVALMRGHGLRSIAFFIKGRWREQERETEAAFAVARRHQIARGLSRCPTMLAMVQVHRGDLERAEALLDEARAAAPPGDRYIAASLTLTEAWIAIERGKGAPSLAALDDEAGDIRVMRLLAIADLGLMDGDRATALAIAARFRALDEELGCLALAAFVEGMARDDAQALTEAHRRFTELGAVFLAARALLARGTKEDAEEARRVFDELGARRWADRARKRLRELGERPPPVRRPGHAGGPLSRRELEVAGLFAQGLTTTEVAKRLIISPHTAAAHLQRIYQRLGVHSRVALTRYLVSEGLLAED
jgi:ATP/maltotriose-dependent transcriptional regulator MalT